MGRRLLYSALLCAILVGCGGGDGSPLPPANLTNDPTASAGLWKGSTETGQQVYGALLSTGTYWVIYSAAGAPTTIAGAVQGTATSINGVFRSTDALDFDIASQSVTPAAISANYVPRNVIAATVDFGQPTRLTAYYVTAPAADLAQGAGSYHGTAAVAGGADSVTVDISATGTISGAGASGCHFSGVAGPRADVPAFDISVTFGGAPCAMAGATVGGIAFYDAATGNLVAAAITPGRTNGFLMLGHKS